ncbi:MAG: ribonuclease Y [Nitrospinaceae bacterium]|nr:ribonuclease Y [Nitrospinaceae bacterium]NIR56560.1 ribonuclease Y [Nitrospinaceae bacterium]NIS87022.1 ribonuclease Y [Nitrospinaceae bacterium]NIT83864.1 ribonuclease Y [Nitrospinaceae bacterium]NIU46069.1 ribonuclease Y [Nitrospinaceae bacterium]
MEFFQDVHVNLLTLLIGVLLALVAGYLLGYFLRKIFSDFQIKEAEALGEKIIKEAEREAETLKKEAAIEAKEEKLALITEAKKEMESKQAELRDQEKENRQKENELNRQIELNREAERNFDRKQSELAEKDQELTQKKAEYQKLVEDQIRQLEEISAYSAEEAKEAIKNQVLQTARVEVSREVKRMEEEAKNHADDEARRIISMAVQRLASDHVAESTVSVVELPNDEIKGRIIGREGRNIRALEQATGIDLIIDDTPGAVVLSGFDPIRREIARRALEKLTLDGRIHPGRIEEVVAKCKKEVNQGIKEAGEQAVMDVGIDQVHPEMVKLLGRLKYRTSYTQNVLEHVKEVAWVCGAMAAELGLDVQLAKRSGLLHDIGKAIDRYTDGTHTQLGVEIANKYNEHKYVANAIAAHHEDVEPESLYAVLTAAGDTISASRPGARREMLETYVKRMGQLEKIGDSFKGVEKTYAIQAGREVRIIVVPDNISDDEANLLSKDVAKRIEKEVTYPGEIKITVVREARYVQMAR